MKILIIGATGLVGSHVLNLALSDPRVTSVVAPARRELLKHDKLLAPLVDFEHLPADAAWWNTDAVICTLGTTIKKAGSQSAFYRIDHDYPLEAARLARRYGTPAYVLNSSAGADAASRIFYCRVKGELERDLAKEGFQSLVFARPGAISGYRKEFRLGERILVRILQVLNPILPRRWRLNPASRIAEALLSAAIKSQPGIHVITSEQMNND